MGPSLWHDERVGLDARIAIHSLPTGWSVAGELDASTSPSLSAAFADLPAGPDRIELDLGELTFIDSSGLRVLIALHDQVIADGRTLVVSSASNPVRRLLEITGLEAMFGLTGDSAPANP